MQVLEKSNINLEGVGYLFISFNYMFYIITIKLLGDDRLSFGDLSGDLKVDSMSSNSFSDHILHNTGVNPSDFGNLFKKTGLKRSGDDDDVRGGVTFNSGMYEGRGGDI
jgi:hypothetical protein